METQNETHPSQRQLAALALGKLAAESRARLKEHVAGCTTCSKFLSDTPPDTLAGLLRGANTAMRAADQSTPGVRDRSTLSGAPRLEKSAAPQEKRPKQSDEQIPQELREQSKYRIVRLLGRGGMGAVYEAFHERMDRRVAIKIINPSLLDHPEALARFDQEVKTAAKLDHPNVAHAYDADEFGTLRVLVMEFVPGESLDSFLSKRGRLTVVEACRLMRQAMVGLDHAHARGMVHRDLKPQNLTLTPDGKVKILDFGLAKIAGEQKQAQALTRTNALMGTPHYLAPEQALDAAKADIRADIYSLGCTLYCLLTGAPPFDGETEMKVLLAHQNKTPRPLCEVCPDVPQELSDLVDRMLAKNPSDRPQTPKEVAEALLPFAKGESPLAAGQPGDALGFLEAAQQKAASMPLSATTRSMPKPQRVWWWSGGAAGLLVAFLLIAWAAGVFSVRTPEGTIIIENVPADADVLVDGETVTLSRSGEVVTITAVSKGDHHLKLVQDGKVIWTSDVAVTFGGQPVRVRYEPLPPPSAPAAAPEPKSVAESQVAAPELKPPVERETIKIEIDPAILLVQVVVNRCSRYSESLAYIRDAI